VLVAGMKTPLEEILMNQVDDLVWWLALLSHSKKITGLNLSWGWLLFHLSLR